MSNDTLYSSVYRHLRENGHEVIIDPRNEFFIPWQLAYRFPRRYRNARSLLKRFGLQTSDRCLLSRSFARRAIRLGVDAVFTELNEILLSEDIDALKQAGIQVTEWFGILPDMVSLEVRELTNHYSHLWCPGDYAEEFLKHGITTPQIHFIGNGYCRDLMYHDYDKEYAHDICFVGGVGGAHSNRAVVLESIAERFESFALFGYGVESLPQESLLRKRYKGWADIHTVRKIYSSSKIVLNLTLDGYDRVRHGSNERLFCIPACRGSLQIARCMSNNNEFFDPDELVQFESTEELLNKLSFYLTQEDERKEMVEKAYTKNCNYTYDSKMSKMLEVLHVK